MRRRRGEDVGRRRGELPSLPPLLPPLPRRSALLLGPRLLLLLQRLQCLQVLLLRWRRRQRHFSAPSLGRTPRVANGAHRIGAPPPPRASSSLRHRPGYLSAAMAPRRSQQARVRGRPSWGQTSSDAAPSTPHYSLGDESHPRVHLLRRGLHYNLCLAASAEGEQLADCGEMGELAQ